MQKRTADWLLWGRLLAADTPVTTAYRVTRVRCDVLTATAAANSQDSDYQWLT